MQIILVVYNLTNHWSFSKVGLKTHRLTALSLFLIFIIITTQYFSSQGGEFGTGWLLLFRVLYWVLYWLLFGTTEPVSLLII